MRTIFTFAAVFCLAACAAATPQQPEPAAAAPAATAAAQPATLPAVDISYQKFVLPNGLTLLVHEDHKAPVVALNVWYHVGSKDEPEGRHGFAHLFEHLMFEGSKHFDQDFFRALEPAGATDMNGTTNVDRTNYFETVPVSALDRALWLEADRMGFLAQAISQAKLEQQRGVVENEKRQDENQPYGKVDDLLAAQTYPPGHPYSWTTIGSEADLNAATLEDVRTWFRTYYGPNNAVLAVAGDVDTAALRERVEHYFGPIPPGPPVPHLRAWAAPLLGEKRMTTVDRVPLPRLYLVWNMPGDGEQDAVLLQMLAGVLGGGNDSRLYERLVYREQIAADVSAAVDANEVGGQFQVVVTAKPGGSLEPVETAVREELQRLLEEGPTAAELERIKTQDYAAMVHGLDKVGGQGGMAGLLAANETFHGDAGHYAIEFGWERQATPEQVREAGRRWLHQGSFALRVLPQEELKAAPEIAARAQLPALGTPPPLRLPQLEHAVLSNGLKLIVAERHGVPVVDVRLVADAGRAADAGGKSGTSALMLEMLDEGAGELDAMGIARREAELGIDIGVSISRDTSEIGFSALNSKLPDALALYARVLREPRFAPADLERVKQRLLAEIVQEKAEPFGVARRVLSRQLYGEGSPYAYAGVGLESDVRAITPDDLKAFHARWLRPDNATLLVVGDTTLAQIRPLLESSLGGWRAPAQPPPQKDLSVTAAVTAPRLILMDMPGTSQSLVLAANLAPPAADPDEDAMQTVDTALGGMFNSRLNLNLREARHWSYGASSVLIRARGPQIFLAYANVELAHTADSLREMRRELAGLIGDQPLAAPEIHAAKQAQVRALPGEFESTGEVAGAVAHLVEFALPDDYWNQYVPRVEALQPPQLQQAAAKLVKPGQQVWIVVGDLARIEAPVRALGFSDVRVMDADGKLLR